MGLLICPKHGGVGFVMCCRHVAEAVEGGRPAEGSKHGPRGRFRWCVCPACFASRPQDVTMAAAGLLPRAVCWHCLKTWQGEHRSATPGYPPGKAPIVTTE